MLAANQLASNQDSFAVYIRLLCRRYALATVIVAITTVGAWLHESVVRTIDLVQLRLHVRFVLQKVNRLELLGARSRVLSEGDTAYSSLIEFSERVVMRTPLSWPFARFRVGNEHISFNPQSMSGGFLVSLQSVGSRGCAQVWCRIDNRNVIFDFPVSDEEMEACQNALNK